MGQFELNRKPTHPGEIIKEDFMIPLKLTQTELARALKTSFRTINEILNEKRSISPEMALRLSRYLGTTPDVWLGLQADYDLFKARLKSKKTIEEIKPLRGRKAA
jgi:addiction module HigA family antidote